MSSNKKPVVFFMSATNDQTPHWAYNEFGATHKFKTKEELVQIFNWVYGKRKWEIVESRLGDSPKDIPARVVEMFQKAKV